MKIGENEMFLSPRETLDDRMIKLQRTPMKIQEERDDIEERTKKAQGALMEVLLSLLKCARKKWNEWFKTTWVPIYIKWEVQAFKAHVQLTETSITLNGRGDDKTYNMKRHFLTET